MMRKRKKASDVEQMVSPLHSVPSLGRIKLWFPNRVACWTRWRTRWTSEKRALNAVTGTVTTAQTKGMPSRPKLCS